MINLVALKERLLLEITTLKYKHFLVTSILHIKNYTKRLKMYL